MTTTAVTIQDLARMLRELRRESCEPNFDAWLRGEAIDEEFASLVRMGGSASPLLARSGRPLVGS